MRSGGKSGPEVLKTQTGSNQAEITLLLRLLQPICAGMLCQVSCLSAGLQDEVNAHFVSIPCPIRGKSYRGARERER